MHTALFDLYYTSGLPLDILKKVAKGQYQEAANATESMPNFNNDGVKARKNKQAPKMREVIVPVASGQPVKLKFSMVAN